MKPVFVAIVFLFLGGTTLTGGTSPKPETTAADDTYTCSRRCPEYNKTIEHSRNYTGNTSVAIRIAGETDVIYDINTKIFGIINKQHKLAFAVFGKFVLVFNTETYYYIIIDIMSNYAVYQKIPKSYISNNDIGYVYEMYIERFHDIFSRYRVISSVTEGSFDFTKLLDNYYNYKRFNISQFSTSINDILKEHFGVWFQLIENYVKSGSITSDKGIWGFLAVIPDVNIETAQAIIDVISVSVIYYERVEIDLIVLLVEKIRYGVEKLPLFADKLYAIISAVGKVSIENFILNARNPYYDAIASNTTFKNTTYTMLKYIFNHASLIRITLNNTEKFEMIYTKNIFFIINLETRMFAALGGKSLVIANRTTDKVFVASFNSVLNVTTANCSVRSDMVILNNGRTENWVTVTEDISVLIRTNEYLGHLLPIPTFVAAMKSHDIKKLTSLLGSEALAKSFYLSYAKFFSYFQGKYSYYDFIKAVLGTDLEDSLFVETLDSVLKGREGLETFFTIIQNFGNTY